MVSLQKDVKNEVLKSNKDMKPMDLNQVKHYLPEVVSMQKSASSEKKWSVLELPKSPL